MGYQSRQTSCLIKRTSWWTLKSFNTFPLAVLFLCVSYLIVRCAVWFYSLIVISETVTLLHTIYLKLPKAICFFWTPMSPAAKKSGAFALKSQVNYFDSQWIPDMKEQWNLLRRPPFRITHYSVSLILDEIVDHFPFQLEANWTFKKHWY